MRGSNKRKSFVEPVRMNDSNFKNETLFVSLTELLPPAERPGRRKLLYREQNG